MLGVKKLIKGLSGALAVLLCCICAPTASAETVNKIELKASGSEAELTFDFPMAAAEEIASVQITLNVAASSGKAEIEFVPDGGLAAGIAESRYHRDTGELNVYIAGTEPVFSDAPLAVGKVRISGAAASATVSVAEGSVKLVRGGELTDGGALTEVYGDIAYPKAVTITSAKPSSSSRPAGSSHTHRYGEWTVTLSATCLREGERSRTCDICARTDVETIPRLEHEYIPLGSHEADGTTNAYTDYICIHCADTKREFDAVLGDVDKSGALNALDAAIILKSIANNTALEPKVADFNMDGAVNALDAAAILKHIVG